jgi:hypothetical protein
MRKTTEPNTLYAQITARAKQIGWPESFATDITWHDRRVLGAGLASDLPDEHRVFFRRNPVPPIPTGSVLIWGIRKSGTMIMILRPDCASAPVDTRERDMLRRCISQDFAEHQWHLLTVTGQTADGALLGTLAPVTGKQATEAITDAFMPHILSA